MDGELADFQMSLLDDLQAPLKAEEGAAEWRANFGTAEMLLLLLLLHVLWQSFAVFPILLRVYAKKSYT